MTTKQTLIQTLNMPVTMTSLQIAELTGKLHKNVIRDIDAMRKVIKLSFELNESSYKDSIGRTLPMYVLPHRETMVLVSGYSLELRTAIIDRWEFLEKERLAAIEQEKSRLHHRAMARLQCPDMTNALEQSRSKAGKPTQWFHYSTEFDMINKIVLGMTAKKYRIEKGLGSETPIRDFMPAQQVEAIQKLQGYNATMMELGFTFDERKAKLTQKHNS